MTKRTVQIAHNCLSVQELIDELENLPKDAKVLFVCDYGDYHHTQQALPMTEVIGTDASSLSESSYSHSGIEFHDPDEDDEDEDESEEEADAKDADEPEDVVIIR